MRSITKPCQVAEYGGKAGGCAEIAGEASEQTVFQHFEILLSSFRKVLFFEIIAFIFVERVSPYPEY